MKMLEGFRLLLLGIGVGATSHARHLTCLQVRFGRLFRRRHRKSLPDTKKCEMRNPDVIQTRNDAAAATNIMIYQLVNNLL